MMTLHYSRMQSPIGPLVIGVSEKGLAIIEFDRGDFPKGRLAQSVEWVESAEAKEAAVRELSEYFEGKRRDFTIPLDLIGTSDRKATDISVPEHS